MKYSGCVQSIPGNRSSHEGSGSSCGFTRRTMRASDRFAYGAMGSKRRNIAYPLERLANFSSNAAFCNVEIERSHMALRELSPGLCFEAQRLRLSVGGRLTLSRVNWPHGQRGRRRAARIGALRKEAGCATAAAAADGPRCPCGAPDWGSQAS
eukprot:scaffold8896_cov67-Phaeocystis_antarctica.AAC.8